MAGDISTPLAALAAATGKETSCCAEVDLAGACATLTGVAVFCPELNNSHPAAQADTIPPIKATLTQFFRARGLTAGPPDSAFSPRLFNPFKMLLFRLIKQKWKRCGNGRRREQPSDPTLSLGWASNGAPWPGAGLGVNPTSNLGVTVSQEVPAPGKRKLRGEIADKEAAAAFDEYLATRLRVISRLKQAYHEMHHAAVAIGFVDRYQELLNDMLRISEARYAVGRAAQQDILRGQTQLAIFATERVRFAQEREARQIEINALLNRPQGGRIEIPTEMTVGADAGHARRDAGAGACAFAAGRARPGRVQGSELAASLAHKDYVPDYTVSGGYFNQGGMPPMWQARVDFKLPAFSGVSTARRLVSARPAPGRRATSTPRR